MPGLSTRQKQHGNEIQIPEPRSATGTAALRNETNALRISSVFNRAATTTLLHTHLLIKHRVERYSVHPILPSHPDKTQTISMRSQVKSIIFFFYSFQETEII